jgi:hypothetical protein
MEEIQKLLADLGESKTGLESEIKAFNLDELSDEQFAEVTAKTDELEKVKSSIKDAESTLEKAKLQNRLSSLLNAENTGGQEISSQTFEPSQKRVVVPAQARARRSLKAYNSEEDAYVSGRHLAANLFGHAPSARWWSFRLSGWLKNTALCGGMPKILRWDLIPKLCQFALAE